MLPKLSTVVILLLFTACGKEAFDYSKLEAFNELHESVSKYSASIDSRNINWDSLGTSYRKVISEDMTEAEYFQSLSEILQEFRDPHIWLLTTFDSMYTIDHLGYEKNFDQSIAESYLTEIEIHSNKIRSAFLNDSIGYLFCADFKGDEQSNNEIFKSVFNKFSNTKGLIIDLRVNDGGSVYNAQNLLNKLTNKRLAWHTTQNRTLSGFDDKYKWFIEPDPNIFYSKKVVVLNGRFTVSAGERFAIGAKLLDNLTIIGDTTANTQGSVMGREMLNGWKYTLTFEKCLAPNDINYAGIGIPPDEYIDFDNSISDNKDYILERAIELLK